MATSNKGKETTGNQRHLLCVCTKKPRQVIWEPLWSFCLSVQWQQNIKSWHLPKPHIQGLKGGHGLGEGKPRPLPYPPGAGYTKERAQKEDSESQGSETLKMGTEARHTERSQDGNCCLLNIRSPPHIKRMGIITLKENILRNVTIWSKVTLDGTKPLCCCSSYFLWVDYT